MPEHIAQAPRDNSHNQASNETFHVPNAAQQPMNYTGTPLREAVGVHFAATPEQAQADGTFFPDHVPSHVVNNPDNAAARENVPGTQPDSKNTWIKRGIAVVAGAAVLGGGGIVLGKSLGKNEAYENILNASPGVSAPQVPGGETAPESYTDPVLLEKYDTNSNGQLDREERDGMEPTDYLEIDSEIRASDRAERFTKYLHTAWESIQPYLTDEEKEVLYMPDLNKPRIEWSDQDYLNYHALGLWLATTQTNTEEGQRALAAMANQDKNSFDEVFRYIHDNPGIGKKVVLKAIDTPLTGVELPATKIGDVTIDENGGRLVGHSLVGSRTSNVDYSLFSNRGDSNGNLLTVIERTYPSIDSVELVELMGKYGQK